MNDELRAHLRNHLEWGGLQGEERLRFLALALAGEVGEMCNEMKKQWRDGHDRREMIISELADVGNYLFMIAECLQVDIHQAMLKKLIEVERRPNAVLPSAGGQAP
jgi:NTP pyrophosphatase (non-canonical NTP hydrolase)